MSVYPVGRKGEATFTDGTARRFDVIIAATGYAVDLPFLDPQVSPVRGNWLDLFHRVVRPGAQGLYFFGLFNGSGGGNIRIMYDQPEWVAGGTGGERARAFIARGIDARDQSRTH